MGSLSKTASTQTANAHPVAVAAGRTPVLVKDKSRIPDIFPDPSPDEPEDLISMERAVEDHVAGAPQSDDLTMVFLVAK